MSNERDERDAAGEMTLPTDADSDSEVDIVLLQTSLAMTPWGRMQANDDALNFAESLQAAMMRRNAKPL